MQNIFQTSCLAASFVVSSIAFSFAAEPTTDTLDMVKQAVADKKAVIVDVREKSEWDDGHVDGAILLPLNELRKGIDKEALAKRLPKERIIYTHCVKGLRSCSAADILLKEGYQVRPLKPGYSELIAAGFKQAAK